VKPHLVLLGDSIFDNGAYVRGGPDVCAQVRAAMPTGWTATLRAIDGSTSTDIEPQLRNLPPDATHLILSVGGNDALMREDVLRATVRTSAEAFLLLAGAVDDFERSYRAAIRAVRAVGKPVVLCTIYNGNFTPPEYQRCVRVAVAAYDDVILRVAAEVQLPVIDLRGICAEPEDYANDIEPSVVGGAKIATAVVRAVKSAPSAAWKARAS
jgi:lysophospholipase L1-like esterase